MIVTALTLSGPLMLLMGIMVAAVLGCAAGLVIGASFGRTRPETPLSTTLQITRDRLAATTSELEKASRKLTAAQRGEWAGSALVLGRRVTDLSAQLGRLGKRSQREEGGA